MAIESSFKNMVLCLFVICLVCSGLLAGVYALTAAPIEAAAVKKTNDAIAQVVPAFDNTPTQETVSCNGKDYSYYTLTSGGQTVGYAIISSASGFGGSIQIMVGVTADGKIYNTSVLSQSETPGLGAKCVEPAFKDQFKNWNPSVKKLSVRKDGGDVDAITASTITSRAYCAALNTALAVYSQINGTNQE